MLTQGQILVKILQVMPYPHQIEKIDLHEEEHVRFTWRGRTFRVSDTLKVYIAGEGVLQGKDISILLEKLLQYAEIPQGM